MPPLSIGKSGSSKVNTKSVFKTQGLGTVDSNHKEKMDDFKRKKEILPEMINELASIKNKIKELNANKDYNLHKELKTMEEEARDLENEINNIQSGKEEYKYLLDAGLLLHQYYDCVNNPSVEKNTRPSHAWKKNKKDTSVGDISIKKNSIINVNFKISEETDKEKENELIIISSTTNIRRSIIKQPLKRSEMLDEYKSIIDPNWVKKMDTQIRAEESICEDCQLPRILQYRESKYVCQKCGVEENTFIDSDRPSFKDPPPEANYFAYKRINHFNELLAQFQAKESTHIPKDVFEMIKKELKKERKQPKDLHYDLVKGYLKKHSDKKYNQYYDHIFHIINRLNGDKPLSMTPEMESNLRYLFLQIQEPFDKYCPIDRKNFISYNFVFNKFCQMLGYKEFLKYFPLLKSKDKLYEQEKIWQKIMVEIGLSCK